MTPSQEGTPPYLCAHGLVALSLDCAGSIQVLGHVYLFRPWFPAPPPSPPLDRRLVVLGEE